MKINVCTCSYGRNYTSNFQVNSHIVYDYTFVKVLLRSWRKEDDYRGIQTMKEQMIHSLNLRFAGIEDNYYMFLKVFNIRIEALNLRTLTMLVVNYNLYYNPWP